MEKRTLMMSILSVVLIAALLSIAYYKNQQLGSQAVSLRLSPDRNCSLQQTDCTLKWAGGEVSLSITPRPIPLVKPIQIVVQVKADNINAVTVDFKGTSMNMGPNKVILKPGNRHATWMGSGMLPVCIRNQMEWQADVYLQTSEGIVVAPFVFVTR